MNCKPNCHYDQAYFTWQAKHGEFGGWANLSKFAQYVRPESRVLDFGCGGGFLLKHLQCQTKIGVEINVAAIQVARLNGIQVYESSADVPNSCVDVIISNNALEHTLDPLTELKRLYCKLVPGGKIVFVVPCEAISYRYRERDINQHLFSWGPMCAGNLFSAAGFRVLKSKPYIHKWPPRAAFIARLGGRCLFELACRLYGLIERTWFQVIIVAEKPTVTPRENLSE